MTTPDQRFDIDTTSCLEGLIVNPPGSLLIARHEGRFYSAFASVPPEKRLTDFSDLGTKVSLALPGDSWRKIPRLLLIMRVWRGARPLGPLASLRKATVLGIVESQIERLVCGSRWAEKTARYRDGNTALEDLQGEVKGSPGFASRMRTTEWTWHTDNSKARAEFLRLANTYEICSEKAICDLALRLAFDPVSIRMKDPSKGAEELEKLASKQILARGAYFARLTSDLCFQQTTSGVAK